MTKKLEISFVNRKIETKESEKVTEEKISSIKMTFFKNDSKKLQDNHR